VTQPLPSAAIIKAIFVVALLTTYSSVIALMVCLRSPIG
jgi:hypothetical protein